MKNTLFSVLFLLLLASNTLAQSLWVNNGFGGRLFVDHRARSIGDTITIILDESTAASQKANTSLDSASDLSVGPGTGFLTFGGADSTLANGVTEKDSFKGNGATDRSSSLTGMISARVIEIMPNGECKLQGRKETIINDETQIIEISGIIRPEYIQLDNTVHSSFLSEAKIAYVGAGPVGDSQSPGLVTKLFGWIF